MGKLEIPSRISGMPRRMLRWLMNFAKEQDAYAGRGLVPLKDNAEVEALYEALNKLSSKLASCEQVLQIDSQVFDTTLEGIVITDTNSRILRVNRAYCELTGYTADEVLGRRPGDLLRSDRHPPEFYQRMWQDIARYGRWRGEIWNRRKDGEHFLESLTIIAIKSEAGELTHYVGVFGDITDFKNTQLQLERISHFDPLTDLPNRSLLVDRLEQSIAHTGRAGEMFALVHLDLDHFGVINEMIGQDGGDRLLVEIARRLRETVRDGDTVSRLGGDEFVLIVVNLKEIGNVELALRRILTATRAPFEFNGRETGFTFSVGVTTYPHDSADAETLLRHAYQAMVEAKQSGRNVSRLFDPQLEEEVRRRFQLLDRLRKGLRGNELLLHYQPKVNLRSGAIVGAEALIRWQHPEHGMLSPAAFLPHAEQSELIVEIGDWVIETALVQLAEWRALGLTFPVSVNVAALQLQREDFVAKLQAALARHPLVTPGMLELEILESTAVQNLGHVRQVIQACQGLGVSMALDDFGTGYSSLAYLKQIPANTLKIDQSFVRNMLEHHEDMALVEGIISLANIFNMKVIAEGLETAEHGVLLMRLGCDHAQGYGIARPMPASQVAHWGPNYQPHPSWELWARWNWELSDFPLIVAQYDHVNWVRKVHQALEGGPLELDRAELTDHCQCRFGKWYYGRGQECYGHLEEFREIEGIHLQVHHLGPQVIDLHGNGEQEAARVEYHRLIELKDRILDHLSALQRAVVRHNPSPTALGRERS